jgi:hypothetical protein
MRFAIHTASNVYAKHPVKRLEAVINLNDEEKKKIIINKLINNLSSIKKNKTSF